MARVPLCIQYSPLSWLAIEAGLGANYNVITVDDFEGTDDRINPNEFNSLFYDYQAGLRFRLVEDFSIGLHLIQSLSPVSENEIDEMSTLSFNVGFRYLF